MPQTPKNDTKKRPRTTEVGDSGTIITHGVIYEEYNTKLQGTQGIQRYDEMRKGDGTVKGVLLAAELPVRRAKWFIKPASEDEQDAAIADFIKSALFDWMSITWADTLRQALLMLPFGVMVFEKVFDLKEADGKTYIVWKKFAPRMPKSIHTWAIAGNKEGIQQRTSDGKIVEIPMEKLLVFVHEKEGDNWWGNAVLRAAYKHWYMKEGLYKISTIAAERQGLGVPFYRHAPGMSDDDKAAAEATLKRMRAHEQGYIMYPAQEVTPGVTVEVGFLDTKGTSNFDTTPLIAHHNREITKAILAQFLELGATAVGSRSLSEDHSELFLKGLETIADNLKDVFNKYAIPELVDFNFSGIQKYPTLEYAGISKVDVEKLVTAFKSLVDANALLITDKDEQYMRGVMGLPERTEEDEVREKPEEQEGFEDDEKPQKKKTASELRFQEGEPFKPWRALTFAEQKVKFQNIQDQINKLENQLSTEGQQILTDAKNAYVTKLAEAARKGDVETVKSLEMGFKNKYAALLKDVMKRALDYGKGNVSKEMGVDAPPTPRDFIAHIDLESDTIAQYHSDQLKRQAKQSLAEAMKKGVSVAQAIGTVDALLDEAITKLVDDTASIVTAGYINHGRDVVFEKYAEDIYALQRSEILDFRTCNYCLSVDGRIVAKDDSFAKNTIFHTNCRGIWVEILNEEEDKPTIAGIPQTLRDRFGDAVNALLQPKNPVTKKNTPANKFVKKKQEAQQ